MPLSDGQNELLRYYTGGPSFSPLTSSTSMLARRKGVTRTMPIGTVAEWAIALVLLVYLVHVW